MPKFAHIVNIVDVDPSSDLYIAQPITFETMRRARNFSSQEVEVELFCVKNRGENIQCPEGFGYVPDLDRSIDDIVAFETNRKLPILKDILDRLYEATNAQYLIYTNVDIGLMPHFYLSLNELIERGYDALVINRRTIADSHKTIEDIPLIYCDIGKKHVGHDCFIFKRSAYPNFELANAFIGSNPIGAVLLLNLICTANNFIEVKDLHLTFHIGDRVSWNTKRFGDYKRYNRGQFKEVWHALEDKNMIVEHPIVKGFRDLLFKKKRSFRFWKTRSKRKNR